MHGGCVHGQSSSLGQSVIDGPRQEGIGSEYAYDDPGRCGRERIDVPFGLGEEAIDPGRMSDVQIATGIHDLGEESTSRCQNPSGEDMCEGLQCRSREDEPKRNQVIPAVPTTGFAVRRPPHSGARSTDHLRPPTHNIKPQNARNNDSGPVRWFVRPVCEACNLANLRSCWPTSLALGIRPSSANERPTSTATLTRLAAHPAKDTSASTASSCPSTDRNLSRSGFGHDMPIHNCPHLRL